jgi:tetratricopeptide (TPR) repeat protein
MAQLLQACPTFAERLAAVEFIGAELLRQPAPLSGFLAFRETATGIMTPERLRADLEKLCVRHSQRWEAWSASAQQAIAMNRPDEARRFADFATERFPLVARTWLDLADVHRFTGDDAGEEAALVRVRQLSPDWRAPALRLASLLQRKLRGEEAVSVLRGTLAHDPLDVALRARLGEALWQMGHGDEAIACMEHAAENSPEWPSPWEQLNAWSQERREPDRALQLARRVVGQRPGDPGAHRQLARMLNDAQQPEPALAEVDVAITLAPLQVDSHDLRAFFLTILGRREEALAACAPPGWANPPYTLAGRAAWVRWQFGERKAAIAALEAVTTTHPDFSWGWRRLAEFLEAENENVRATTAAEKFAELCPDDPIAWGWLASLKIKTGDKRGAIPSLERAVRLNPNYEYALFQLLRVACESEQWDAAERALALIRRQFSKWHALQAEIILQRSRLNRDAALAALAELCAAPEHHSRELLDGVQEFADAGWLKLMERIVFQRLALPDANPETGGIWMRARLHGVTAWHGGIRRLARAGASDAVQRTAWQVYLEWLANNHKTWALRWLLFRHGPWLAAKQNTWGTVSFALAQIHARRRLVRWMRDWSDRKVEPWMLSNLAHTLIALGDRAVLRDVVHAGLRLPSDHTRASFVAWAAWLAAVEGRYEEAGGYLSHFENPHRNEFAALFAAFARARVDVNPAAATPPKFREIRDRLKEAALAYAPAMAVAYMAREHRRTLRDTARRTRSLWRWWYVIPEPFQHWRASQSTGGVLIFAVLIAMLVSAVSTLPEQTEPRDEPARRNAPVPATAEPRRTALSYAPEQPDAKMVGPQLAAAMQAAPRAKFGAAGVERAPLPYTLFRSGDRTVNFIFAAKSSSPVMTPGGEIALPGYFGAPPRVFPFETLMPGRYAVGPYDLTLVGSHRVLLGSHFQSIDARAVPGTWFRMEGTEALVVTLPGTLPPGDYALVISNGAGLGLPVVYDFEVKATSNP